MDEVWRHKAIPFMWTMKWFITQHDFHKFLTLMIQRKTGEMTHVRFRNFTLMTSYARLEPIRSLTIKIKNNPIDILLFFNVASTNFLISNSLILRSRFVKAGIAVLMTSNYFLQRCIKFQFALLSNPMVLINSNYASTADSLHWIKMVHIS